MSLQLPFNSYGGISSLLNLITQYLRKTMSKSHIAKASIENVYLKYEVGHITYKIKQEIT